MKLTGILDILDIIIEYGTYISLDDILYDSKMDKDNVMEILNYLIDLSIIRFENNKYIINMTYEDAYNTFLKNK